MVPRTCFDLTLQVDIFLKGPPVFIVEQRMLHVVLGYAERHVLAGKVCAEFNTSGGPIIRRRRENNNKEKVKEEEKIRRRRR